MKTVFLTVLLTVGFFCAHSQTTPISPEDLSKPAYKRPLYLSLIKKPAPKNYLLGDIHRYIKTPLPMYLAMIKKQASTSYLLVEEGSMYRSALDNMPCVIPRISSVARMPVLNTYLADMKMPNPYIQLDIFPTIGIIKPGIAGPKQ